MAELEGWGTMRNTLRVQGHLGKKTFSGQDTMVVRISEECTLYGAGGEGEERGRVRWGWADGTLGAGWVGRSF